MGFFTKLEQFLNRMITKNTDVKERNLEGKTALHFASRSGDLELVSILIEKGAEVDSQDRGNRTPLIDAIEGKNVLVIQKLINCGASVKHSTGPGWSVLHHAAMCENSEAVSLLLDHGASIDQANEKGYTPLHAALDHSTSNPDEVCKIITRLVAHGSDVNAKELENGHTPLMLAVFDGNLKIVETLLTLHARVDIPDNEGTTVLTMADSAKIKQLLSKYSPI